MSKYKVAGLYVPGWVNNEIFNINHPANIDNWLMPFVELKKIFFLNGYDLSTIDLVTDPEFIISFSKHYNKKFQRQYFFLTENEYIIKYDKENIIKKYDKIFTWDDRLVDGVKFIKYNYPQFYNKIEFNDFKSRKTLLTLISNNKCLSYNAINDMYLERYKIISFFEDYNGIFKLYGAGWDRPLKLNSLSSRLINKLFPELNKVNLKNYSGFINSKLKAYSDSKFSLCFENVSGIPGYITEKIFDSMFAGCIPIYSGASNICNYIPSNCWIDYSRFDSYIDMYKFLLNFSEQQFNEYQNNIINFLDGEKFKIFSSDTFCKDIVKEILG